MDKNLFLIMMVLHGICFWLKLMVFGTNTILNYVPILLNYLNLLKNVTSISISFLSPGKHIPPHNGPYKGILRYQLAISVPKRGVVNYL